MYFEVHIRLNSCFVACKSITRNWVLMMPKIVRHSPHMLKTIPAQHKKKKDLKRVPAKDPPKIKLENFHNSRVPELW